MESKCFSVIKKGCLSWISNGEFIGYSCKPNSKIVSIESSSNSQNYCPTIYFFNHKQYKNFSPIFSFGYKDSCSKFIPYENDGPKYYSFGDMTKIKCFIGCTKINTGMIIAAKMCNGKIIFYFWDEKNCSVKPICMKLSENSEYVKVSPVDDCDAVIYKNKTNNCQKDWYNPDSYVFQDKKEILFGDTDVKENLYKKKRERTVYKKYVKLCDSEDILTEQKINSGNKSHGQYVWNHKPECYENIMDNDNCKNNQKIGCGGTVKYDEQEELTTKYFYDLILKTINCKYNKCGKYDVTLETITSVPKNNILILGFMCAKKIILVKIPLTDSCCNDCFTLSDNFKCVCFDICELASEYKLSRKIIDSIKLEDITYDGKNETILLLTSHTNKYNGEEGGYIWCVKWYSRFKTTSLYPKPAMLSKTVSGHYCPRDLKCYPCSFTKVGNNQDKLMIVYDKHCGNKFYFEIMRFK